MLDTEEIENQQQLLITHRRTLEHLIQHAARYGGLAYAPPEIMHGINDARTEIKRVKEILQENGVTVTDYPDDASHPTVTKSVVDKSKIRLYAEKIRRELHSNAAYLELPIARMPFLRDDNYCSLVKSGNISYLPFSIFKNIIHVYNKTHYMNRYISRAKEKDSQINYSDAKECKTTLLSMIDQLIIELQIDIEGILGTLDYDDEESEGIHFIYALRFELEANKEWLNDVLQTCNYLRVECWEQLRESDYVSLIPDILYNKTEETYILVYIFNEQHIKVLRERISEFDADTTNETKQELTRRIDQMIELYDRCFPKISTNFKR